MNNLLEAASFVSLVTGVTEVIKRALGNRLATRFIPLMAIAIGILLALITGRSLVEGLVVGLSGVGLYSTGKTVLQK